MDVLDLLNRPALALGAFLVATAAGFAVARVRGAIRGALLAVAAGGVLVAVKAAQWMPDAAGWLATGVVVAAVAVALAWWLPLPLKHRA